MQQKNSKYSTLKEAVLDIRTKSKMSKEDFNSLTQAFIIGSRKRTRPDLTRVELEALRLCDKYKRDNSFELSLV